MILKFNQRKIIPITVPIEVATKANKKLWYRQACAEIAKHLMSNNAIRFDSDICPTTKHKYIRFWITTYEKTANWDSL